jgi:hypothetical protein
MVIDVFNTSFYIELIKSKANKFDNWMDTSKHMPQITLNSFNGLELSNPYVLGFQLDGHSHKN